MIEIFDFPTRIVFGPGSVARLGSEARKLGKRAMLVTGMRSARQTGLLDRVTRDLERNGLDIIVFDKIRPNPHASTVDEGVRLASQKKIDLIIALGGGSVMDSAKGIAVASATKKPIWDYVKEYGVAHVEDYPDPKSVLPLLAVPTMAASGSECSMAFALSNDEIHEKRIFFNTVCFPKLSIVDPELTLTLSKKQLATGAVDILDHIIEPYVTGRPCALTDGIMETLMRLVVNSLPQALAKPDDIEARTALSWASSLAGTQIPGLGGGAGYFTLHFIERPLEGFNDCTHGEGLAAMLPAFLKSIQPVRREKLNSLGKNVFGEADGITAVEKWLVKVGMRLKLRNLGFKPEDFSTLAEIALKTDPRIRTQQSFDMGRVAPIVFDASAIVQMLKASY